MKKLRRENKRGEDIPPRGREYKRREGVEKRRERNKGMLVFFIEREERRRRRGAFVMKWQILVF